MRIILIAMEIYTFIVVYQCVSLKRVNKPKTSPFTHTPVFILVIKDRASIDRKLSLWTSPWAELVSAKKKCCMNTENKLDSISKLVVFYLHKNSFINLLQSRENIIFFFW